LTQDVSCRKPLVAAVEGFAIAGGLEIAFACDVIVAANDAIFGLPEVRHGLVASGGGLLGLSRRTSLGAALEFALSGTPIGAVRAQRLGLVDQLTAPGRAGTEAYEVAAAIAKGAPGSLAATKEILREGWGRDTAGFHELERRVADEVLASADAAEGISAFAEGRAPSWRGR
jgi:enoyl-CoA hydratase